MEAYSVTVGELASHIHPYRIFSGSPGTSITDSTQGKIMGAAAYSDNAQSFYCEPNKSNEFHIYSSGNNEWHNNVSPCIAAYCWRRIV